MTRLQEWFVKEGGQRGLRVDLDVKISLPSGRTVLAPIHLHSVGASRGMVIASNWAHLESAADELASQGFGYSIIDEPTESAEVGAYSFDELLEDWGVVVENRKGA